MDFSFEALKDAAINLDTIRDFLATAIPAIAPLAARPSLRFHSQMILKRPPGVVRRRCEFDFIFARPYHDLRMRTCPECNEPIGLEAEDCPHCGASFSPSESETPGITDKETDSTKYFMAAGIILLGLWALAWFVIPWHFSGRQDEAEVIVRDALASVQTGLSAYESASGTYPSSLSSLGDTAIVAVKKAHSAR